MIADVDENGVRLELTAGGVSVGAATTCGNYMVNLNPAQTAQVARCSARTISQGATSASVWREPHATATTRWP